MINLPLHLSSLLFDKLNSAEIQRLQQIDEFWEFYNGDQWEVQRTDGEKLVTINYIKAIVDKSVSFSFGKGVEFQVDSDYPINPKEWLDDVWEYNKKQIMLLEAGQMGGITGDVYIKVSWEDGDKDYNGVSYDDLYPNGRIRIDVLPTSSCFPVFCAHDRTKLDSFVLMYSVSEVTALGTVNSYIFREETTRDEIITYHGEKEVSRKENKLREINVVHICNLPVAGDCFGQSDIWNILELQKEYNQKNTDISDIINYHAAPITILKGVRPRNMEKGAKKLWSIPEKADVYNLELQSDLAAASEYVHTIKLAMHELSNTPEEALGKASAISNTTGIALQIKYAPILEKSREKWITYGEGLKQVCWLIFKFLKLFGEEDQRAELSAIFGNLKQLRKLTDIEVSFPDPMPKDELLQLQAIAQKMGLGLMGQEKALEEIGSGEDIAEQVSEADEYLEKMQKFQKNPLDAQKVNIGQTKAANDATATNKMSTKGD